MLKKILLFPIYILLYLLPRNKNILIFGSNKGKGFSDNAKYLYCFLNGERNHNKKIIYLSRENKVINEARKFGEAYHIYSIKGMYYSIRAKYFFNTHSNLDFEPLFLSGAIVFQLWHGMPLKKIGDDADYEYIKSKIKKRINIFLKKNVLYKLMPVLDYKYHSYILLPNKSFSDKYISAFGTKKGKFIYAEQPRVTYSIGNKNLIKNYSKVISLFPTHRGHNGTSFFNLIEDESFIKLNKLLHDRNYILYIKPHPVEVINCNDRFDNYSNILIYSEIDPYPLANVSDLIVTDYSSIYLDMIGKNKKFAFLPLDFEFYMNEIGMYFDYFDDYYTPGPKFISFNDFIENLDSCFEWSEINNISENTCHNLIIDELIRLNVL